MKPLVAAALLAAVLPAPALGAGLVQQRDVRLDRRARVVAPGVFELVGVHWRGPGAVGYRTRNLAGRWSAWRRFTSEDARPDPGREARATRGWRVASPFWSGPADAIQYRALGRVTKLRAYFVRSPRRPLPSRRFQAASAPPIVTRAGWHADEAIRRAPPYYADRVHLVFVHHTAGSNAYTRAQSASIVRAIELYHVKGNGWNDIGYNFLVDKYGQVFEGRYGGMTRPVIGAHTMGFNSGSVGIALIGDYGSASITPAARAALVSLIAWRLDLAHVDPASSVVRISAGNPRYPAGHAVTFRAISGHRDAYPTSCPGASLYAQLPAIRSTVLRTGLPKLYSPVVTGVLGGPVRFTARLSSAAPWTVTVRDETGEVVASGSGTGAKVDWTWDATNVAAARYAWAIAAPQARSATGSIGAASGPLALQGLRVSPAIVSPNGDGRGEKAKVSFRVSAPAVVRATVQDVAGNVLAAVSRRARSARTQSFVWSPSSLRDGWYTLILTATAGTQRARASARFWVDRTLAATRASPRAISPNGDGVLDSTDLSFRLLAPARVQVRVLRGAEVVTTLMDADLGPGPETVAWDGTGLPDGSYTVAVAATDSLLTVTQTVPLRIDRARPSLRLVSLARLVFRIGEPGRLLVGVNGRWRRVTVRRPGYVRLRVTRPVRGLTAVAVDLAGNRSRTISVRR